MAWAINSGGIGLDGQIDCQFVLERRPEHFVKLIMSLAVLMEKIQERLNQVDQNNRKVVAIFQVKAGDANWGKWLNIYVKQGIVQELMNKLFHSHRPEGSEGVRGCGGEPRFNHDRRRGVHCQADPQGDDFCRGHCWGKSTIACHVVTCPIIGAD